MKLVLLKSLFERDKAQQIKIILDKNNIESKINFSRDNLEMTYGQQSSDPIEVYVYEKDFEKGNEVIAFLFEDTEDELKIDEYTDKELEEIVLNPDDWHKSFVEEAKVILDQRGIKIEQEEINKNLNKKIKEVKKGVPVTNLNLVLLWMLCVFGALLGLAAGYFLWQGKTRASDGSKHYLYDIRARKHGRSMLLVGIVVQLATFLVIINFL